MRLVFTDNTEQKKTKRSKAKDSARNHCTSILIFHKVLRHSCLSRKPWVIAMIIMNRRLKLYLTLYDTNAHKTMGWFRDDSAISVIGEGKHIWSDLIWWVNIIFYISGLLNASTYHWKGTCWLRDWLQLICLTSFWPSELSVKCRRKVQMVCRELLWCPLPGHDTSSNTC